MAGLRTSLEKLQALDNDYTTIDSKLDALQAVLDIQDLPSPDPSRVELSVDSPSHSSRQGRSSFALRWLCNRLKTSSEARSHPKTWSLLTRITLDLPQSTVSKLLLPFKIADIVLETLIESFPVTTEKIFNPIQPGDDDEDDSSLRSPHNGVNGYMDRSSEEMGHRKRKRREDKQSGLQTKKLRSTYSEDISKASPMQQSSQSLLLYSLASFLYNAEKSLCQVSHSSALPLKTNPETASKILGMWMNALCLLEVHAYISQDDDTFVSLLTPVLSIWQNRTRSQISQDEPMVLARNVLVPATLLLALIERESRKPPQSNHTHGALSSARIVSLLEALLARHVFVPARVAFHDTVDANKSSSMNLGHLLDPSKHYPIHLTGTAQPGPMPEMIPTLFSIAIRCTPRSTTKRRLAEQPWLEKVFTSLVECLPLAGDHEGQSKQTVAITQLVNLLQIAKRHRVKLGQKTLKEMAISYSGINQKSEDHKRWNLLARVAALDTQTLTDPSVLGRLLHSITTKARRSNDLWPIARGSRDEENDRKDDYTVIRDHIIKPLMRTFSSMRQLTSFVELWHSALVTAFATHAEQANSTLWEDHKLRIVFGELLESSLTPKQITEQVQGLADGVQISELEEDSHSQCFASCQLLKAFFHATRSNELTSALLPIAQQLLGKVLKLLFSGKPLPTKLKEALWQLAASSFHLWSSTARLESIEADRLFASRHPPLARCSETFGTARETVEAVACLASMYADVRLRHVTCKNIEAGLKTALHCYISQLKGDMYEEHIFASTLAEFPSVFELYRLNESPIATNDLLGRVFTSAARHSDLLQGWLSLVKTLRSTPWHEDVTTYIKSISEDNEFGQASKDLLAQSLRVVENTKPLPPANNHARIEGQSNAIVPPVITHLLLAESKIVALSLEAADEVQRSDLIDSIIQKTQLDNGDHDHWRLLYQIIQHTCQPKMQHILPQTTVPALLDCITQNLPLLSDWQAFNHASATLSHFMRYFIRAISQFHIEQILTAIQAASTASSSTSLAPSIPSKDPIAEHPSKVYLRLCHLTHLLLTLHRRKLTGRLDILLPVLQSLLTCLYTTPTSPSGSKSPSFLSQQPSWLITDPNSSTNPDGPTHHPPKSRPSPLTPKHAAALANLLTTLFDPSPSLVTTPRSHNKSGPSEARGATRSTANNLTDHTLRARRHLGQHAPHLLLHLCTLQLEGRFADEGMRECLRPGVWGILDCMALVKVERSRRGESQRQRSGERSRGKENHFLDVVVRDEGDVWGVGSGLRTVVRGWWEGWSHA